MEKMVVKGCVMRPMAKPQCGSNWENCAGKMASSRSSERDMWMIAMPALKAGEKVGDEIEKEWSGDEHRKEKMNKKMMYNVGGNEEEWQAPSGT